LPNDAVLPSRAVRLLTRTALVAGFAIAANVAGTLPAQAAGASITNDGARTFSICENAASETACASGVGSLSTGQNSSSKYGWGDTDMIYITARCTLHDYYYMGAGKHGWGPWAQAGSTGRWFKVTDNNGGRYKVIC